MIADLPPARLLLVDLWPTEPILPSGSKSYFHWKYFGKLLLAFFYMQVVITQVLWHVHNGTSDWSAQKLIFCECLQKWFDEMECTVFITCISMGGIPLTWNVIWERYQVMFPGCLQRYRFWCLGKNSWPLMDVEATVRYTKRISEFLVGIC